MNNCKPVLWESGKWSQKTHDRVNLAVSHAISKHDATTKFHHNRMDARSCQWIFLLRFVIRHEATMCHPHQQSTRNAFKLLHSTSEGREINCTSTHNLSIAWIRLHLQQQEQELQIRCDLAKSNMSKSCKTKKLTVASMLCTYPASQTTTRSKIGYKLSSCTQPPDSSIT